MIKSITKPLLFFFLSTLLLTSCGTYEEYVLLNDVATPHEYAAPNRHDLHIKRGDDLLILVAHHIPKLIENFNRKVSVEGDMDNGGGTIINSYRVNSHGYITFPVFDTIYVLGMTCRELEEYIENRIDEEGFASHPTVHVKIKNFKVSVVGETGNGVYEFDQENVTLLDLLAKANLTGNANIRRDKILMMRDCDTTIKMDYLSLLSTDIIYSPYYYLQQNDIIYVYPSQTAIRQSNKLFEFWWSRLSILTTAVSVATLFLTMIYTKNASSK